MSGRPGLSPPGARGPRLALRAAALALCLLLALPAYAGAAPVPGIIFAVIDGDTALFKPDHYASGSRAFLKIRLADIDAPERDQPYGPAATRALSALVLHRRAEVETVATDAYGRKIAHVTVGGVWVNRELVQRGHAWTSTRYRRDAILVQAQRDARSTGRGLWRDAAPTPPWVWRREQSAQR